MFAAEARAQMDEQLKALKRRIGESPRDARGHRQYSDELRREIIRYVVGRERQGVAQAQAARDIGLTPRMVWGWVSIAKRRRVKAVELIDEEATAEPEVGTKVLVLPGGSRIEGLELDDVVALVRALS